MSLAETHLTAKAGPDQTVKEGDAVQLDGRDSEDPDDDIISYLWEQTDGTEVALTDSNSVMAGFIAPDVGQGGEALIFQLTVTDNNGWQSSDTCIVNVTWENMAPTAKASGPSQPVYEGSTVTLDSSGSSDPDDGIASWVWIQTKGKPVTLSDSTASQPTFVCPPVGVGGAELTFQLKVTDLGGLQDTDEISITIKDNGITGFPDDVITCKCTSGRHIGIRQTGNGNLTRLNTVDPETITSSENRPQDMIYGLFDFEIKVPNAGSTARITFYLPDPASNEHRWIRYIPSKGWIDFSRDVTSKGKGDGAEFNGNRTEVTLYITDNGDYDDDPRSGIIRDPSGLGIPSGSGAGTSSSTYTGGGGGGGGGCFIATAASETDTEPACQFEMSQGHAPSPEKEAPLSKEEQQKRSVELFRRIFDLSRSNDRPAHLNQMMDLYYQIIEHYPDAPLAQESYWRLIEICFKDFQPPKKDKALSLYKEFQGRYPDSPLKNVVNFTMTRLLYLNGFWNDLLAFTSPGKEDFSNPKASRSPLPIFFYSEAKFHLNDFQEASRGYRAILEYFPDSHMAVTAGKRMEDIKKGN